MALWYTDFSFSSITVLTISFAVIGAKTPPQRWWCRWQSPLLQPHLQQGVLPQQLLQQEGLRKQLLLQQAIPQQILPTQSQPL
jgi:hypothetical protein